MNAPTPDPRQYRYAMQLSGYDDARSAPGFALRIQGILTNLGDRALDLLSDGAKPAAGESDRVRDGSATLAARLYPVVSEEKADSTWLRPLAAVLGRVLKSRLENRESSYFEILVPAGVLGHGKFNAVIDLMLPNGIWLADFGQMPLKVQVGSVERESPAALPAPATWIGSSRCAIHYSSRPLCRSRFTTESFV